MPSGETRAQLAGLKFDVSKPLIISDVDEVVVHFTRGFEAWLEDIGLWLDAESLALDGNIKHRATGAAATRAEVMDAVEGYFAARTRHFELIEDAAQSILRLAARANVVFLTNLPHACKADRVANLADHGLHFPVITNSGPKGPAIKRLAALSKGPAIFIDDSPQFLASANEHAPAVTLIHFMHDQRFARHVTPAPYVSLFTGNWPEALAHMERMI